MDSKIKKILNELYELDGSLKEKEVELLKIIEKMLATKPNIKIDEDFKNNLKIQIIKELDIDNKSLFSKDSFKYLGVFLS
jgi:hypothetical protein